MDKGQPRLVVAQALDVKSLLSSIAANWNPLDTKQQRWRGIAGAEQAQRAFVEQTIRELEADVVKLSKSNIDDLASRAKLIASLAVPLVGLLFAAVQLKDFPFLRVAGSIPPQHLFPLTVRTILSLGSGLPSISKPSA